MCMEAASRIAHLDGKDLVSADNIDVDDETARRERGSDGRESVEYSLRA